MGRNLNIGILLTLLLIITYSLGLLGFDNIPDVIKNLPSEKSLPFTLKLSPTYFDEGNYDYNDKKEISIEINKKYGRNITYLELSKENFKVSRQDEGLNKPTSDVRWEDSRDKNIVSFGNLNPNYRTYGTFPLKAEGEMIMCKNCFIGDQYPYVFTFTIYYKEDNEELKSEIFNEIIPIK